MSKSVLKEAKYLSLRASSLLAINFSLTDGFNLSKLK
ncbi:Uncharacterised protein [Chlamydia abortus]|nr:Uncharacterised protein [Chlamydia abortus]